MFARSVNEFGTLSSIVEINCPCGCDFYWKSLLWKMENSIDIFADCVCVCLCVGGISAM